MLGHKFAQYTMGSDGSPLPCFPCDPIVRHSAEVDEPWFGLALRAAASSSLAWEGSTVHKLRRRQFHPEPAHYKLSPPAQG